MRALRFTLIILAIVYAGSGCASIRHYLPPYTLDQGTSDALGTASEFGEFAADASEAGYAVDKAATGHK